MCEYCKCRYSFLGAAYFCPACGKENVPGNVMEGFHNIENFISHNIKIKEALNTVLSAEDTESYFIQLIEEHYCKIVALFQKYSENMFLGIPNSVNIKIRKNLFQNIAESSQKWKELKGKGYDDIIDISTLTKINRHFQIRHLLSHTGGIIDQDFVDKINDKTYIIGKRISIDINELSDFIACIQCLIDKMNVNYKQQ